MLIPVLLNGYPLVYPDTGTYLLQAIELYGAQDRPPFYSLLIFPFHLKLTLWPVALMQAVAIAFALRIVMGTLLGEVSTRLFLGTIAVLTLVTSLPWHAGQIVPDVFTAVIPLLAFELSYQWSKYTRWQRAGLSFVACGVTTLHFSHLPLAIGVFIVVALVRLAQGFGLRDGIRVLAIGWLVTKVASMAFLAYSYALVRKPTLSPSGNLFMAARVLADGPGRAWLKETCPANGAESNVFCAYQDRLTNNADEFLWDVSSPLVDAYRTAGDSAVDASCGAIVWGVIKTRPVEQLRAALGNSVEQFVHFGTLDTDCPARCGETMSVNQSIRKHFAGEYPRFLASAQMRDVLPRAMIRVLDTIVVIAAGLLLLWCGAQALHGGDKLAVGFTLAVLATLAGNALIAGTLSSVHDRYQSRVIWLVPFAALVLLMRLRRARNAPRFG